MVLLRLSKINLNSAILTELRVYTYCANMFGDPYFQKERRINLFCAYIVFYATILIKWWRACFNKCALVRIQLSHVAVLRENWSPCLHLQVYRLDCLKEMKSERLLLNSAGRRERQSKGKKRKQVTSRNNSTLRRQVSLLVLLDLMFFPIKLFMEKLHSPLVFVLQRVGLTTTAVATRLNHNNNYTDSTYTTFLSH